MILKAGTYRFNDTPSIPNNFEQSIVFTITDGTQIVECNAMSVVDNTIADRGDGITYNTKCLKYSMYIADYNSYFSIGVYNECESFKEWSTSLMAEDILRNTTLAKDTEVDDTFGSWFISNTNYNEVNGSTEDKEYIEKSSWYKSVADAIRSKKGTTAPILRDNFASEISSITGGGETPYYDGTVIIEKAESVLGLRRFKETLSPIESSLAVTDQWGYFGVYKETHFEIEPLTVDELGITIYGMSPLVNFTDNNSPTDYPKIVISATENGGSTERTLMPVDFSNGNLVAGVVVNVISTNGTIVDEWLLANTEGVSV